MPPKGAKVLCDQGVSGELMAALRNSTAFQYAFTFHEGWAEVLDGELLTLAEENGFAVIITADQNMIYQQNMRKRKIGVVILGTNDNETLLANVKLVAQAVQSITRPGKIARVQLATPKASSRKKK